MTPLLPTTALRLDFQRPEIFHAKYSSGVPMFVRSMACALYQRWLRAAISSPGCLLRAILNRVVRLAGGCRRRRADRAALLPMVFPAVAARPVRRQIRLILLMKLTQVSA
jgi:hypothetical protein